DLSISPAVNLPIDSAQTTVTATPPTAPGGTGTDVFILLVEFFQEVNGTQYSLNDGGYNALNIVDVV
ncbi:MAG TPA: hypothetical protein VKY47_11140, partial [Xanthomarina sp.]|nr:hypothetical protein [Xanthomarina sp.]